jgi:arylsulfatase A-like enzyme
MNRTRVAAIAAIAALTVAAMWPTPESAPDRRVNVILVVTDDQAHDTMPSDAMPWLQAQLAEPGSGWTLFPNAFSSTPMCCPARATLLTGGYSFHTGVRTNLEGDEFDETRTLAVWLDEAGYTTGLIGKYLNHYPWARGPYIPPGWDRWFAKLNPSLSTTYANFPVIDQGVPWTVRGRYVTDALADEAVQFVHEAPLDRPFFLLFAPSAPHAPYVSAPRHTGGLVDHAAPPLARLNDVDDAAPFVRNLPAIDATRAGSISLDSERAREALLAVDEALHAITSEVAARGQHDRTVVIVLSDNGLSFGEHRWVGKNCPYEACVRTPIAMFVPGSIGGESQMLASNVDVAPTIAELTQTEIPQTDGMSLVGSVDGASVERDGVLLTSVGDRRVPEWWAVRTERWKYVAYVDGFHELYDLANDPYELVNVADDPAVAGVRRSLDDLLATLSAGRSNDR